MYLLSDFKIKERHKGISKAERFSNAKYIVKNKGDISIKAKRLTFLGSD